MVKTHINSIPVEVDILKNNKLKVTIRSSEKLNQLYQKKENLVIPTMINGCEIIEVTFEATHENPIKLNNLEIESKEILVNLNAEFPIQNKDYCFHLYSIRSRNNKINLTNVHIDDIEPAPFKNYFGLSNVSSFLNETNCEQIKDHPDAPQNFFGDKVTVTVATDVKLPCRMFQGDIADQNAIYVYENPNHTKGNVSFNDRRLHYILGLGPSSFNNSHSHVNKFRNVYFMGTEDNPFDIGFINSLPIAHQNFYLMNVKGIAFRNKGMDSHVHIINSELGLYRNSLFNETVTSINSKINMFNHLSEQKLIDNEEIIDSYDRFILKNTDVNDRMTVLNGEYYIENSNLHEISDFGDNRKLTLHNSNVEKLVNPPIQYNNIRTFYPKITNVFNSHIEKLVSAPGLEIVSDLNLSHLKIFDFQEMMGVRTIPTWTTCSFDNLNEVAMKDKKLDASLYSIQQNSNGMHSLKFHYNLK